MLIFASLDRCRYPSIRDTDSRILDLADRVPVAAVTACTGDIETVIPTRPVGKPWTGDTDGTWLFVISGLVHGFSKQRVAYLLLSLRRMSSMRRLLLLLLHWVLEER